MKNLKTPIKSLTTMAAMMFVIAVLFTASFAQSNDRDGDGVIDRDDACPDVKGTKASQGCPDKNEKIAVEAPAGCLSGNCVNGKGKLKAENGDIYEGDFVNSRYHGTGLLTYPDGSTYQGFFASGKREGTGLLKRTNGDKYVGNFANDKINGFGIQTLPNGDDYTGNFVNGRTEGYGTFTKKNGNYFKGEWKDGKLNGSGTFYDKQSNTFQEGLWKDNVLVEAVKANNTEANATPTLEQTILQIIADGENDFSKYIGEKLPQNKMLPEVQPSKYGLTLGGSREQVVEGLMIGLITFSSDFGQNVDQFRKVKVVIDKVVKQKGYTVRENSDTVTIENNNGVTILYYGIEGKSMLSSVTFYSTSKKAIESLAAANREREALFKNPAAQENIAMMQFKRNTRVGRAAVAIGTPFKKTVDTLIEILEKAKTVIEWNEAIDKYRPIAVAELKVIETNYKEWEVFLNNAKTLTAERIAAARKTIEGEKATVVSGWDLVNSITKRTLETRNGELEQTILQIIADGENGFSKYIGEKLPKIAMLPTVQASKYGLTLGGSQEQVAENSISKSITFSSNFGQNVDQFRKVKAAIGTVVKQNGYTVREESDSVWIDNNKGVAILYYDMQENGVLCRVIFRNTSKRTVDREKEQDRQMAADNKNPKVLEVTAQLNFQHNSNANKELTGVGFRKITKEFVETFQAAKIDNDKKMAFEKYLPLAIKELKVVEANYREWEVFLSTAKTLTAQQIAEDRKTIESEKAFVVKGREFINSLTKK